MKLNVSSREKKTKATVKTIRREGNIPAILYSKGAEGKELIIDGIEFQKLLNKIERGTLSSIVFEIEVDGKKTKALVKDIQYHVVTYNILHIDLIELFDDVPVTLNVPLKCVGAADCAGVKAGGVLRQVLRHLKVRTLPKHIPSHFDLDVKKLGMGQAVRLSAIKIPETVRPMENLKVVAAVVGKR
jgi:large subunit ribosomal protein L25